jgi:hypothetical protein
LFLFVVCCASMLCLGGVGARQVPVMEGGAAASRHCGGRGPPVAVPWTAEFGSVQGMCLHGACVMVVFDLGRLPGRRWHASMCQGGLGGEAVSNAVL